MHTPHVGGGSHTHIHMYKNTYTQIHRQTLMHILHHPRQGLTHISTHRHTQPHTYTHAHARTPHPAGASSAGGARRPRPSRCQQAARLGLRAPRAPSSLTSLLLADEEAALGVGERCRVTRAMAAARRGAGARTRARARAGTGAGPGPGTPRGAELSTDGAKLGPARPSPPIPRALSSAPGWPRPHLPSAAPDWTRPEGRPRIGHSPSPRGPPPRRPRPRAS